jgi:hypothetical protein
MHIPEAATHLDYFRFLRKSDLEIQAHDLCHLLCERGSIEKSVLAQIRLP